MTRCFAAKSAGDSWSGPLTPGCERRGRRGWRCGWRPSAWAAAWTSTQVTTMLLLRHGATELSAERRFAGRGDVALTSEGRNQARLAAKRLAVGPGIGVIVTSPLQRARHTAEAVAEATGAPLVVDEGLAE